MPTPVTLPRLEWGTADAARRVLLVHGLGSTAALMWRLGTALADAGFHATAVDLRGHGDAPRTLDYTIAAYATDLGHTRPVGDGPWDAVVGHSLGGASSTVAAASDPSWTRRLVLIDPAIHMEGRNARLVARSQERAFADNRIERVREENPLWHPIDVELKVDAVARSSAWAVAETSRQNERWDVREAAARLAVPTHVIGSDPEVLSIFTGDLADEVLAGNPRVSMSVVPDAGHSPHRDRPEETVRQLLAALG